MSEMSSVMDAERVFIEHEHREMAERIDRLHDVAAVVGTVSSAELSFALGGVLDWVKATWEPHAAWEEAWLYPRLDALTCTSLPSRLMRYEHGQIWDATHRLRSDQATLRHELRHEEAVELRGRMYALETLIRAHLDREEHLLLPMLDAATA